MIILKSASITCLNTDAVVNAANEQLMEGGGVCGYIFAAAGPSELQVPATSWPHVKQVQLSLRRPSG